MKTVRNLIFTILWGAFLCIVMASCDNFLTADEVRAQIEEAIEIANANSVTMYVVADEGSGSVIPEQITKKKNQSFNVKFNLQKNWQFINWEVIDTTSGEVVPDAARFENPTSLETKVTLLKPDPNYQIHAKCILLPAIVSVSPANFQSASANSPVYITFNMPMEDQAVLPAESIFGFGDMNITAYCGSKNMQEYFDIPSFADSTKRVLVLTPKSEALINYIKNVRKVPYVDVLISFGQNIVVQKDQKTLAMSQDSDRFVTIRYTADDNDTEAPSKIDLFVTRHEISLQQAETFINETDKQFNDYYVFDSYDEEDNAKMLQNRTNGTIYIYGKYYDKDSGVRAVTVIEELVNATVPSSKDEIQHVYFSGSDNAEFIKDPQGNTYFCIKCNLESADGAVSVKIHVSDVAGKVSNDEKFVAVKKSHLNLTFGLSNGANGDDYSMQPELFNKERYISSLKTIFVRDVGTYDDTAFTKIYPVVNVNQEIIKQYELRCEYIDKQNQPQNKKMTYCGNGINHEWNYTFDVEKVSGLEFKIIAKDELGNTAERSYKIPDSESFLYFKEDSDNLWKKVHVVSKEPDFETKIALQLTNYEGNKTTAFEINSNNMNITSGEDYYGLIESYQIVPIFEGLQGTEKESIYFVVEPSESEIFFESDSGPISEIQIKTDSNDNPVVHFDKSEELYDNNPALKVTVYIADDSWDDDQYDIILMKYNGRQFLFEKDNPSCSFLERTDKLIGDGNLSPVWIYGYKGDKATNGTLCTIPKIESETDIELYDNIDPYVNDPVMKDCRTFTMSFTDYESGPDIGIFKVKGINKEFVANEANNFTVNIPITYADSYQKKDSNGNYYTQYYYSVECRVKDKAGNETYDRNYDIPIPFVPPVGKVWNGSPTWGMASWAYDYEQDNGDGFKPYFYVDKFVYYDENTGDLIPGEYFWENYAKVYAKYGEHQIEDEDDINYGKWYYMHEIGYNWEKQRNEVDGIPEDSAVSLISDSFLRIYCKNANAFSIPYYYYYPSDPDMVSYDKGDILQVNTNKSVLISSSLQVLVYTITTQVPYSECVNWDINRWEFFNLVLGEELLDFDEHPRPFLQYDIPYDEITNGSCYVVVARFTSGKVEISPVYQKE